MTERLYYADPYLSAFEARILENKPAGDRLAVVLDRSVFYPTGGGQPYDTGHLNGVSVLEVVEREQDGAVVHLLAADTNLVDGAVHGEIDWPRRFDHMQQHTGQHILSQAFVRLFDADTVGFHLSDSYSTIDINRSDLDEQAIRQAEELANQVVFEDRPVMTGFMAPDEVANLPLRKPPDRDTHIRIVQVEGFDWSACGGTHTARTGAVGLIKITHVENRGAELRLTFLCGGRTLEHYRKLNDMTSGLALGLSIGVDDLPQTVQRLAQEARDSHKEAERLRKELEEHEAGALLASAQTLGPVSVVCRVFEDRSPDTLRRLARGIVAHPAHVALFGAKGKKAQLLFARSPELDLDLRPLLKAACQTIQGGGGGSPDMVQGGGARSDRLDEALRQTMDRLTDLFAATSL